MKLSFQTCAVTAALLCTVAWQLNGQTTGNVSAVIQFSDGQTAAITDFSNLIGVQPNELVNVTLQFGTSAVGQTVVVEAPDGGSTSLGSNVAVVGNSGTLSFAFHATAHPGQNKITIRRGGSGFTLKFLVGPHQG